MNPQRLLPLFFALCARAADLPPAVERPVDFVKDIQPIFQQACVKCHGPEKQKGSFRLDVKAAAFKGGDEHSPAIIPGKSAESPLIHLVAGLDPDLKMPPKGDALSAGQIGLLRGWIDQGAAWPESASAKLKDPIKDHWAFQPVSRPPVPAVHPPSGHPIDAFIFEKLAASGLQPAPEADRPTLIRRLHLVLHGLPPSPEDVEAFANDADPQAYEKVVDRLLQSPRYGERWAQHWLDLVRYADTDGFEVNTERPNAWPYRDYVIRALNNDTPYDRFIKEQLAGDSCGEDAATGFLVTAAALLPGQIGQDDISKRLARQDSLDEIVSNTGQAFLAMSVGCARCHDHKFDPIPQRDYYAVQAFFSGVQYGERPIQSAEAVARRKEAEALQPRLAEIDRKLAQLEPLAQVGATSARETSARLNEETFAPLEAKFVRFTIHDANLHPALGLIEPCLDELEVFTADGTPRNVALATLGAKVTASGSRTSDIHRLEHLNDGKYGNSRSWMSDEPGRGWVVVELPEKVRIGKIAWSRDREGKLTDRLATAYTIDAGPSLETMTQLVSVPPPRPAVHPRLTTDRFAPVLTQRLRFTVSASMSLEPCVDELEIFTAGPGAKNIALASAGTKASASGTPSGSAMHRLEHINDGKYGNSRSWMSNELGRGWIELEFPQPQTIDRVLWSRDREEKFSDRLPLDYRIEVADAAGAWRAVAGSQDRRKYVPGEKVATRFSAAGLSAEDAKEAARLVAEKQTLQPKIAALTSTQKVFAGSFTKPAPTHLLHRGDPEQTREAIVPAVLSAVGSVKLSAEAGEQERRVALGSWIASTDNPLTARVMVNRIWQGHFGRGLVDTASDFGHAGTPPSHPALLDWLAAEFMQAGWSMKHLHQVIVTSATFRQSNRIDPAAQAMDGDCRLLWRFPGRRLEAETIRDSILAVNGRLDLKMGGPGFNLFTSRGGLTGFPPVESFTGDGLRRMIYAHKVRMERDAVFGAFDCPDAGQSAPRRGQSTTPVQALNLFNSRFTIDEAAALAKRVQAEAGADAQAQIVRAYNLALGRNPDAEEIDEFAPIVRAHGLPALCRALFNTNEFLFLP